MRKTSRLSRLELQYALTLLVACVLSACNPYACETDARSAAYVGRLGQSVAPTAELSALDSGRIFIDLNEWRGSLAQQNVSASVNVQGFLSAVSEIHVHEGTPANPGRLLWKTGNGFLVRDTVWNVYTDLFAGPASWADFWSALDGGRAYFEVHSPSGASVTGALRQESVSAFTPSCT
jgi:hypothetical protein